MSKHTPGPWRLSKITAFSIEGANGRHVASSGGYSTNVNPEQADMESMANARLIAAAPELLETLEKLMEMREQCFIPNEEDWWDNMARSAIRKAKEG